MSHPPRDHRSYARRSIPWRVAGAGPDDWAAWVPESRCGLRLPTRRAARLCPGRAPRRAPPPGHGGPAAAGWGAGHRPLALRAMLRAEGLCVGDHGCAPPGHPHRPGAGGPRAPPAALWALGGRAPHPGGHRATRRPRGPPRPALACGPGAWPPVGLATDGSGQTLRWPPPPSCVGWRPGRRAGVASPSGRRAAACASGLPQSSGRCGPPLPSASPRLAALPPVRWPRGARAPRGAGPGVVPGPPGLASGPAARGASVGPEPVPRSARSHGRHENIRQAHACQPWCCALE